MKSEAPWIKDLLDLKRTPRSGWSRIGVERPESVADHSLAVGLLAWRLAAKRGLDAQKALLMGLCHDFHEARLGDIPSPVKQYLPEEGLAEAEKTIRREQWSNIMPEMLLVLEEFERGESPEAKLVKQADSLELLLQARRYRACGYEQTDEFLADDLEKREDLLALLEELDA